MTLMQLTLGQAFVSEFVGTAVLILLGVGVVANALLKHSKGEAGGNLMINFGWGIAVMAGVFFAAPTGGHLNPAVTVGLAVKDLMLHKSVDWSMVAVFIIAQFLGAMVGATLAWLVYKMHYDTDTDPALKLGTFATGPAIRSPFWNCVTEFIATFVLVGWCIVAGLSGTITIGSGAEAQTVTGINYAYFGVTMLIVGIGASLGGPTGYAINPARDLGPRIMHAILPIKGKGGSDWGYSWVPVVGPLLGAIVAGIIIPLVYTAVGFQL